MTAKRHPPQPAPPRRVSRQPLVCEALICSSQSKANDPMFVVALRVTEPPSMAGRHASVEFTRADLVEYLAEMDRLYPRSQS